MVKCINFNLRFNIGYCILTRKLEAYQGCAAKLCNSLIYDRIDKETQKGSASILAVLS